MNTVVLHKGKKIHDPRLAMRALAAIYKAGFNPAQPRDEHGQWTDDGGGSSAPGRGTFISGGGEGGGGGGSTRDRNLYTRNWDELKHSEKIEVASDRWTEIFERHERAQGAHAAQLKHEMDSLARIMDEARQGRRGPLEDRVRGWHANEKRRQDALRLQAERQRASDPALQMFGREKEFEPQLYSSSPPGENRKAVAEVSGKLANVARLARQVLEAIVPGSQGETLPGRTAATIVAVATLAGAVNGIARSKDIGTAAQYARLGVNAAKNLKNNMPLMAAAAKKTGKAMQTDPRIKNAVNTLKTVETQAKQAATSWSSTAASGATRAVFHSTGGKIVPSRVQTGPKLTFAKPKPRKFT